MMRRRPLNPHVAGALIFFLGTALGALLLFNTDGWVWWIAAFAIWIVFGTLGERVFRRLATPEEIREDLANRADSID